MSNTATTDNEALVQYRGLVSRAVEVEAELTALRSQIDATLAEMADGQTVTSVAEQVGLGRQEVHRRIARHRQG